MLVTYEPTVFEGLVDQNSDQTFTHSPQTGPEVESGFRTEAGIHHIEVDGTLTFSQVDVEGDYIPIRSFQVIILSAAGVRNLVFSVTDFAAASTTWHYLRAATNKTAHLSWRGFHIGSDESTADRIRSFAIDNPGAAAFDVYIRVVWATAEGTSATPSSVAEQEL